MKIVYISYSFIPSRRADSVHVMKMCQAMALNGHEVILLVPDKRSRKEKFPSDPYEFYGVQKCFEIREVFCPPLKGKSLIFSVQAALIAKKLSPDILYTRSISVGYCASFFKTSIILEYHESINTIRDRFFIKKILGSHLLKRFIVITNNLKLYFEQEYPKTTPFISVLPDGADPAPSSLRAITMHNQDKKLLIGYTGHLYKGRGIEIIEKLAQICLWAEFHIIGGNLNDISYWQSRLMALRNVIVYGYMPHGKIFQYLSAFDILIAPYQERVSVDGGERSNGGSRNTAQWMSPLKIFEYMAVGKPIIASNLPVLREILEDNINALLVVPDNVEGWKEALIKVRDNSGLRQHLGLQAKFDLEEKYSWAKRAEKALGQM